MIACGIDASFFADIDRLHARSDLGFDSTASYVLFPANPDRTVKNYQRFAAVLDRVRKTGRDIREVVLYDPSRPRSAVPQLFAAVDVMLLTSDSEGSPQVVKEAICAGLPVVSTDVGDVKDRLDGIVPGGVAGVPGTDEAQLVTQLGEILIQILDAHARSDNRSARDQYSNANVVRSLTRVYEEAIEGRTHHPSAP
jgi:glycosyltransferase involved in cell wall biosynthesis